jgi:sugar phosphate isomerase/epimerase
MKDTTRRQFLAAASAAAAISTASAKALNKVGVQLYTVRSIIGDKTAETVQELEKIGFREAECVYGNLDKIYAALKQTRIQPVSLHLDTQFFTKNQDKLPAALNDAKSKGFRFVVCPYIAPQDRGGEDVMKRLADTLNQAGETCRKSGLRLAYHNHAFEFEPVEGKGTLLDILLKAADPKLVTLELDIMWSQVAGVDPVSVLRKYGRRVTLMHLKNLSKDVTQRYNEKVPREGFKEVGAGVIDIAKVLAAAEKAGVEHYFVEQDQTPGNPLDSLRQSHEYLSKLSF